MKIKNLDLVVFFLFIAGIITSLFFIFPQSAELFAFSGSKFFDGEFYRLMTFQFFHKNVMHLVENLFTLAIIGLLAYEVSIRNDYLLASFIISSSLIALICGIVSPFTMIVGASVGLYSILGSILAKGKNYVPYYVAVPIFSITIFIEYFTSVTPGNDKTLLLQSLFHFGGLFSGALLFISADFLAKKQKIKILTNN
jgi:membrane associated rhomboid family serine protease